MYGALRATLFEDCKNNLPIGCAGNVSYVSTAIGFLANDTSAAADRGKHLWIKYEPRHHSN